jgi:hypothetical protein
MRHVAVAARYQPTYEELKRDFVLNIFVSPPCYQPTYEELKQLTVLHKLLNSPGYQPTYEELKPD